LRRSGTAVKTTNDTRTVLTHQAYQWSTAKPTVVKVTLPREPWDKPLKEEEA